MVITHSNSTYIHVCRFVGDAASNRITKTNIPAYSTNSFRRLFALDLSKYPKLCHIQQGWGRKDGRHSWSASPLANEISQETDRSAI